MASHGPARPLPAALQDALAKVASPRQMWNPGRQALDADSPS
ncbi:hypothetical protein [Pseudoduganella sp. GCM10020061]